MFVNSPNTQYLFFLCYNEKLMMYNNCFTFTPYENHVGSREKRVYLTRNRRTKKKMLFIEPAAFFIILCGLK